MAELTHFFAPFFPPPEISSFWGLQLPSPALGLKKYFRPLPGGSIRLGHLFRPPPLNGFGTPTLLHRSTGSRFSPDISFASSSLALSCSWEVLHDLGSDHLPILLSVPLFSSLSPQRVSPILQLSESSLGWVCLLP